MTTLLARLRACVTRVNPRFRFGRKVPPLKTSRPVPKALTFATSRMAPWLRVRSPEKVLAVLRKTKPPPLVGAIDWAWTVLLRMPTWTELAPTRTPRLMESMP